MTAILESRGILVVLLICCALTLGGYAYLQVKQSARVADSSTCTVTYPDGSTIQTNSLQEAFPDRKIEVGTVVVCPPEPQAGKE